MAAICVWSGMPGWGFRGRYQWKHQVQNDRGKNIIGTNMRAI